MFPTLDSVFFDTRFLLSRVYVGVETVINEDDVNRIAVISEGFEVPFSHARDYNSIDRKPRKRTSGFDDKIGSGQIRSHLDIFNSWMIECG